MEEENNNENNLMNFAAYSPNQFDIDEVIKMTEAGGEEFDVFIHVSNDRRLKKFKGYLVQTTHSNIVGTLKTIKELQQKSYGLEVESSDDSVCLKLYEQDPNYIMDKILKNIKKYSLNQFDKEYEKGSEKFMEWGGDVIFFYCHRAVYENRQMPIASPNFTNQLSN